MKSADIYTDYYLNIKQDFPREKRPIKREFDRFMNITWCGHGRGCEVDKK